MIDWWKDFHFGARLLLRRPGFTLLALLALAVGVGATSAMFSLTDQVLFQPLPYQGPDRLVMLWETNLPQGLEHEQLSPVNFLDYRRLEQVFEDAAGWWRPQINLTDADKEPVRVSTIEVTSNFFDVLGVYPVLGSDFESSSDLYGDERHVMISHRLWQNRYGADPDIVGKVLQLNSRPNLVVGVMPSGFQFPGDTDMWQRMAWDPAGHSRYAHFMESVARLQPNVSLEQANRELAALSSRLQAEYPESNTGWGARAVGLHREIVGIFHEGLLILFGAVGLLLLLACSNVANMLLARGSARQRELAVRSAIGASRGRVVRQLLTESLTLGLGGGLLGLLLAWSLLKLLLASQLIEIPRVETVSLDMRVLGFTFGAAVLTSLLFGLAPALQLSHVDLNGILKEEGRGPQQGSAGGRLRGFLVVFEVALSVILLVGSGLLVRSFWELSREDPGFDPAGIFTVNIEVPSPREQAQWARIPQFFDQLVQNLESHPAISQVSAVNFLPLDPAWRIPFWVKNRPAVRSEEEPEAQYVTVVPGYFRLMGIPFLAGRDFDSRDHGEAPGAAIVNRELARRIWPQEEAVGETLLSRTSRIGPLGRVIKTGDLEFQVVGVVDDVKNNTLQRQAEPAIYFPNTQFAYKNLNLVVRGEGSTALLNRVIREEVQRLDANLPVPDGLQLGAVIAEASARPRFVMLLMCGFATLALILAALGIYGVLSYAVSQRTREIGIRMALGAGPSRVRRLVVGQGFTLVLLGAVLGLASAWALGRVVTFSGLLYKVPPSDLAAFTAALLILLVIAWTACYAPARRASRVDPIRALRAEG